MSHLATASPAYIAGFVKTCAQSGIDEDATIALLEKAQMDDLHAHSPAFKSGFDKALKLPMEKRALLEGFGGLLDKGISGIGKGLWAMGKGLFGRKVPAPWPWPAGSRVVAPGFLNDLQRFTTKARLPAVGLGALAGGGLLTKHVSDMYDKGKAFDDLNLFKPSYLDSGTAGSGGMGHWGGGGGPFDYMNAINRNGAASSGMATGGSDHLTGLKQQLNDLAQQSKAQYAIHQKSLLSSDPAEQIAGMNAQRALQGLQHQQAQLHSQFSGVLSDQQRMQESANNALTRTGKMIPEYSDKLRNMMNNQQSGGWFNKLRYGGEEGMRSKSEEYASMLQHLNDVRQQAQTQAGTQLL